MPHRTEKNKGEEEEEEEEENTVGDEDEHDPCDMFDLCLLQIALICR